MGGDKRQLQIVLRLQDEASKELRKLSGELDNVEKQTANWSGLLRSAAKSLAVVGTAAAGFVGYGVKIAADLQTAQVGLETLLGSAEEADKTIARLKVESARTPFELPGLTQATQLLSSVTKDGDKSIDILLNVGEALAAMGKGQAELDRIIVNLQQIAATGRAASMDIRQFAFAGIPIYEMLTEATGKSGEALEELISSGGVTFELLTEMFDKANDAGGRFFNAFNNQGGTFNQALSNMKDSFGIFLADIATGTGVFDALTEGMMQVSHVLTNYREIISNAQASFAKFFDDLDAKTGLVTLFMDAWANVVFMWTERLKPALLELWETLKPLQPILDAMVVVFGTMLVGAIGLFVIAVQGVVVVLTELLTWAVKLADYFLGGFADVWDFITDKIASVIDVVEDLISKFQKAIDLASKVGGKVGKIGSSVFSSIGKVIGVNDAVISPKGDIISTHPDDYLIATKNPKSLGGGTGPIHITLEMDGREISKVVLDNLMGQMRQNAQI